jgi:ribonuclease HI
MNLKIEIKNIDVQSNVNIQMLIELEYNNEILETKNYIFDKKEIDSKLLKDLLFIKYSSLFHKGLKVTLSNKATTDFNYIKPALKEIRDTYSNNVFVLNNDLNFSNKDISNATKLNKQSIQDLKVIFDNEESIVIEQIRLSNAKKIALMMIHMKNGKIIKKENSIFNSGIVLEFDKIKQKIDNFLELVSKNPKCYIQSEKLSDFIDLSKIEKYIKKVRPFSEIVRNESFLLDREYQVKMAEKKYQIYLKELNNELEFGNNTVVFTDGGKIDRCGASSYFLINKNQTKTEDKTVLLSNEHSNNNEQIALLLALKKVLTYPKKYCKKIHFVCDSDILIDLKTKLEGNNSNISKSIENIEEYDLYKEVKELYKNKQNKIYFHFLKSHTASNDFISYGNRLVDNINTKRMKSSPSSEDLSKNILNFFKGNYRVNFATDITYSKMKLNDEFNGVININKGRRKNKI